MFPLAAIPLDTIASLAVGTVAVGTLYALHHLRIKPTRESVATLIFWNQAALKQRARVPWFPRLTHFWTFVLLSLISIATAASLSANHWGSTHKLADNNAIVMDIGSSMTATSESTSQTSLSIAIKNAVADLSVMPDTPAVILAGTQPILLVQPSEPLVVAKRRLTEIGPAKSASASASALNLAGNVIGADGGTIYWYTDRVELPADVATAIATRVKIMHQPLPTESINITGADFISSNDNPFAGTLHVSISGKSDKPFCVAASVGTENPLIKTVTLADNDVDVLFDDIPASGQTVTLNIKNAPGAITQQSTTFQLPIRVPLKFQFIGSIPRPLRLALLAIGKEASPSEANIVVVQQGQPIPANKSAVIEVIEQGTLFNAGDLLMQNEEPLLAGLSFENITISDGPMIPSTSRPLLKVGNAVVAGLAISTARKIIYLSKAIVGNDALLPRLAAFPVLVQRLSDFVTGCSQAPAVVTSLRQITDPLWISPKNENASNNVVFEPPLLAGSSNYNADDRASAHITLYGSRPVDWTDILLACALITLVIEGSLYAAKKIY